MHSEREGEFMCGRLEKPFPCPLQTICFSPQGSVRPYVTYVIIPNWVYLPCSANAVKCDVRQRSSCSLHASGLLGLAGFALSATEAQQSWKINTNCRCQSSKVKHIHQCNIIKRNLGIVGEIHMLSCGSSSN